MADKHEQIVNQILIDWTASGRGRLLRNDTGQAWLGKSCKTNKRGAIILEFARKIPYGLDVGSSDLFGFEYREYISITGIRHNVPVICSVEVKTIAKPKLSKKQIEWLNWTVNSGGFGYLAIETTDGYELTEWKAK